MLKSAKYQIYFYVLPTFLEIFTEIKQVWSQLQPQKKLKGRFKIYALSLSCSHKNEYWHKVSLSLWDLSHVNSWILKNCRYHTVIESIKLVKDLCRCIMQSKGCVIITWKISYLRVFYCQNVNFVKNRWVWEHFSENWWVLPNPSNPCQ